ncbi:cyclin-dependent kinase 2-interacting protein isoform X2 [Sphaeramia orbicularis]|uniref:cyclin-dependent kinase 2-interacting protein isoform X2 n=1 Tax=Sphaeramia orbicularis TaxID=375764 RepID=UPI00117C5DDA|nr:cyclin-dependent kinase 2-interacting protein isoform X2 [Sphaeramia orbicularis]
MEDAGELPSNRKCSALTGSSRKIKDNAADWHNLLLRWERLNDHGFDVAQNIVNLRLRRSESQHLQLQADEALPPLEPAGISVATLQQDCDKLQEVYDKMVALVTKMERLVVSQHGISELEQFQFGVEGRKTPLFHSWNAKHFEDVSVFLLDSFQSELRLKGALLQDLAHTVTSDLHVVHLSCWLLQPFVPPQVRLMLEALLLETGHRPI